MATEEIQERGGWGLIPEELFELPKVLPPAVGKNEVIAVEQYTGTVLPGTFTLSLLGEMTAATTASDTEYYTGTAFPGPAVRDIDQYLTPAEIALDHALPETEPARFIGCNHIWSPRRSSIKRDFHHRPLYAVECSTCKRRRVLSTRQLAAQFFAGKTSGFLRTGSYAEAREARSA